MRNADIGLIGLGVMGENLALNIESKGFRVAVYNRTIKKINDFINSRGKNKNIIACKDVEDLIIQLNIPRKILMMVKAGEAIDSIIEKLIPFLEKGDIIIDGGNSNYKDTIRRSKQIEEKGFLYIGMGISGGTEGALYGPSLMPGGSKEAWTEIKEIFQKISAKFDNNIPCCEWIGDNGAGHFVKMVHNGIEYGDMQIICEAFHIMRDLIGLTYEEMQTIFKKWDEEELNSYLIRITSEILAYKDKDGDYLIKKILDEAEQKGTGKWTAINALDLGVPLSLITESVFARNLSSKKRERIKASKVLKGPETKIKIKKLQMIDDLKDAIYMAKIISYAQGFTFMQKVSNLNNWNLNFGNIALIWRNGCIIRSNFLHKIKKAYDNNPELENLIVEPYFKDVLNKNQFGLRKTIKRAIKYGIPIPAMGSALNYFDGYRTELLPANLLQAQRDYFGAHTYRRIDKSEDISFHTNWTGKDGDTINLDYKL